MSSAIMDLNVNVNQLLSKSNERERPHQFDCGLSSQQFPLSSEEELQMPDTGLSQKETRDRFIYFGLLLKTRSPLGSSENEADPDVAWKDIQAAVETAVTSISNLNHRVTKDQWISSKSITLMDSRKLVPSGSE
ncbi:unnamed protein product, partial [Schistosoma mattheei]